MDKNRKKRTLGILRLTVLNGAFLLLCLVALVPVLYALTLSFSGSGAALSSRFSFWPTQPTLENYRAILFDEPFLLWFRNSVILSVGTVFFSMLCAVPAAYAFARFKFRLGESIAFTLLSFRFAPPLLVLLPLSLYYQELGLNDTYFGIVWVYQLIALPLILWIVRGYFEDISPDIEHAYRLAGHSWREAFTRIAVPLAGPGIAAAGLLSFIFCWNNFVFALILASADKQPVTVGALAFVTASGIQYGQIAAAIVLSVTPTLLLALYAQRYLVEGLSLGAVKG